LSPEKFQLPHWHLSRRKPTSGRAMEEDAANVCRRATSNPSGYPGTRGRAKWPGPALNACCSISSKPQRWPTSGTPLMSGTSQQLLSATSSNALRTHSSCVTTHHVTWYAHPYCPLNRLAHMHPRYLRSVATHVEAINNKRTIILCFTRYRYALCALCLESTGDSSPDA
jgi:hypothetical protein